MFDIEIDTDYLKNNFNYASEANIETTKANLIDTHWTVYGYIEQEMFAKPSLEEIYDYIELGYYEYLDDLDWTAKITCPISDATTRLEMFKRAIAKQFIYDDVNGRSAMVGGEFVVCADTLLLLKNLGLLRKTFDEV